MNAIELKQSIRDSAYATIIEFNIDKDPYIQRGILKRFCKRHKLKNEFISLYKYKILLQK